MIKIAVSNHSTVVSDADVNNYIDAVNEQIAKDYAPVWGTEASLYFIQKDQVVSGVWQCGFFDTSDQAGALGYHDVTPDGLPLGHIFAKSDLDNNSSVSVTLSHEILEMLGDPTINIMAYVYDDPDTKKPLFYMYENCDAVEADEYGYKLTNGSLLSDFVYPCWFEIQKTDGPYDRQGLCKQPCQLMPGGYIDTFSDGNWNQITARGSQRGERVYPLTSQIAKVGSRRERRLRRNRWFVSNPAHYIAARPVSMSVASCWPRASHKDAELHKVDVG